MARKHSRSQSLDCNTKMPEDLTEEIKRRISLLQYSTKADYLKKEVFSKFVSKDTDPPEIRRTRAINKWLATERDNEATNDRLILTHAEYNILPRVSFASFVSFCRNLVSEIIGESAPVEALIGAFSGGASTSRARTESFPASKYLGKADVTVRALGIFASILEEIPGWDTERCNLKPEIVPGNVMFTVPKKTDIDRVACKEPDINMFLQKGIGSYFRTSLRNIGINLNDQSINRSLARKGSLTGELATFDLSSASDSVTSELVALLLPECWFTLLDSVRSPVTLIGGEEHRNHMFSSMGNGFTFELESLLFYVLTRAICYFRGISGVVSVYGDDIICPVGISTELPYVFAYFGFSVNLEKSFVDGPFRESCGGHYYNGRDITPFYIKAPIERLVDVIHVANSLRKWAEIEGHSILDPEVEDLWFYLKSFIPECFWGGDDCSFKYQLVSNDIKSRRIVEETIRKDVGIGGYYHWLNATWDRTNLGEGVSTSSRTINRQSWRSRSVRNPTVTRLPAIFLKEIG